MSCRRRPGPSIGTESRLHFSGGRRPARQRLGANRRVGGGRREPCRGCSTEQGVRGCRRGPPASAALVEPCGTRGSASEAETSATGRTGPLPVAVACRSTGSSIDRRYRPRAPTGISRPPPASTASSIVGRNGMAAGRAPSAAVDTGLQPSRQLSCDQQGTRCAPWNPKLLFGRRKCGGGPGGLTVCSMWSPPFAGVNRSRPREWSTASYGSGAGPRRDAPLRATASHGGPHGHFGQWWPT
jgi:hypothetical protein